MTFLPIVARELTQASRRRWTYWSRLAMAITGLIIAGWVMIVMRNERPAGMSMFLFGFLAVVTYLYALFAGVFSTADCLSEEKREGTLGLLFLTDLKGYDIVFGKLAASSLNAIYSILALFPIMAIPLLMGGVTIAEFWRVVLVSMNTLFFSLAVGMFCSAISRDERRAMVVASLVMLFFTLGLWILGMIVENVLHFRGAGEYMLIPSPACAAAFAFDALYNSKLTGLPFNPFYPSVIFTHALSWVLLISASIIVPRTWQDRALTATQMRRREKLNEFKLGSSHERSSFRQRLLEVNPFYWLTARHRTKPLAVWAVLGLGAIVWALGLFYNAKDWMDQVAYFFTAFVMHTVLKFWIGTEACRQFSKDRQSGALELLLSTPISVKEIIRGQWMALERQFGGPLFVVLLADLVFLLASRLDTEVVVVWIAGMIMLVADVFTLGWVGMWCGLNSRRPNRAAGAALVRVLVLPWMIFLILLTFIGLNGGFGGRSSTWNSTTLTLLWLVIGLVNNVIFALPARRRLLAEFRQVATERFETRGRKSERAESSKQ